MNTKNIKEPIEANASTTCIQIGDTFVLPKVPELEGRIFVGVCGLCDDCCFASNFYLCASAPDCCADISIHLIFEEV